jgi:cellobiose-specific phosphotransferase system component IIA
MMKRLILADLRRALKEAAEGDADECMEALDHAAQLLAEGH